MSIVEDYLVRIKVTLANGSRDEIRDLAEEIHGAFAGQINGIEKYSKDDYGANATALKQLRGKLLNYLDDCDREIYGGLGLETISGHIRYLESALAEGLEGGELKAAYDRIDRIYGNCYDSYADGLSGFLYSPYEPCDEQTILRIQKLRHFRDKEMRSLRVAEAQASSVSMVQSSSQSSSATATANVQVSQEIAFEQIDNIPETTLSEADKTFLKGMLADLQAKDSDKRESKLKKVQNWLADKGVDVFNAAMPYIVQLIQSQMGK